MKKTEVFLLLSIVALAVLIRFWKLDSLGYFTMDEEYANYLARNIVYLKHFPAIGVNVSDTGLYLGPGFIYLSAIIFFLTQGNPVGQLATGSFLGVIETVLIFFVGWQLFSKRTGFWASVLYAGSFLASSYDRRFWNPTLVPLLSISIFYLLTRIANGEKKPSVFVLLFFALGLSLHFHLSLIVYFAVTVLIFVLFKVPLRNRSIGLGLLAFLITQVPILLFEIRHNFLNTKALFGLIGGTGGEIGQHTFSSLQIMFQSFGRFIYTGGTHDLANELVLCPNWVQNRAAPHLISYLTVALLAIFAIFFKRKKIDVRDKKALLVFTVTISTTILFLLVSPQLPSEYYFIFLFPLFALFLGFLLSQVSLGKFGQLTYFIISIFLIFNLRAVFETKNSFSLQTKRQAADYIKQTIDKTPFQLESLGACHRFDGYRFLFEQAGLVPVKSYVDPYFSWIYGEDSRKPQYTVVVVSLIFSDPPDEIAKWLTMKNEYLKKSIVHSRFDNIEVIIIKND